MKDSERIFINPKEIAKGIITYDEKSIHYTYVSTGNPFEEYEDNKNYLKIKKDKNGKQYLHVLFADCGGYDVTSFRLYFDNDEDLLNFLRR